MECLAQMTTFLDRLLFEYFGRVIESQVVCWMIDGEVISDDAAQHVHERRPCVESLYPATNGNKLAGHIDFEIVGTRIGGTYRVC